MRLTMKTIGADIKTTDAVAVQRDDCKGISLDLNTVKRTNEAPPRTRPRIFGLKEAPIFYPTEEEFQDPIKYIQKIRPEGEKFGIVKIVPPESYKPEFALNTEEFRFRTRVQKLNSMEGETRANVNYLEQLYKFHRLHGHPVNKVPQLDKRPIDLFRLKKEVAQRGGYQTVTSQKKWAEIGRILGYTRKQCTSMSNALKSAYARVILPYEVWLAKHKQEEAARMSPPTEDVPKNGRVTNNDDLTKNIVESVSATITTTESSETSEDAGGQACEVCHSGENESQILLCDGCDCGYHMSCLSPPLTAVPKADWFCIKCLTSAGRDYGFEDGPEYTLRDFQKLCDKFKTDWFADKPHPPSEEDCEDEFWRLVENPHETCEAEYGADLHSTQHGSGFTAIERAPGKTHSSELWNLNVIPVLPNSLFTHIKTDISGMMVPWLYVGMCFSAFCWHNEDHFTYSINYMHWGETKTWYGVPGRFTAKFEDTMRSAVPELFEQQPDLLFELVTMLNPGRLLENDVEVYAVDQRPGQFVVTFPKAYHSGFNHGFNFCEAVNFAPNDWINYDLECVKLYKKYRRQPCFSHDELLVTAARDAKSAEAAQWLQGALAEMQQREITSRDLFVKRYPKTQQVIEDVELHEDQQQCVFCNCYVYLSRVTCTCTTKASCLEHATELCTCDMAKKTLYCRFTNDQLENLGNFTSRRTLDPNAWIEKVQQTLNAQPLPTLKILKELLSEATHLSSPVVEVQWLRDYVNHVTAWIDEAKKYLIQPLQKHHQEPANFSGKRYQRIQELLSDAEKIAFDAHELSLLQNTYEMLTKCRNDAERVLLNPLSSVNDYKDVYQLGITFGGDLPEMAALKKAIQQKDWNNTAPCALEHPDTTYDTIVELVKTAQEINIPADNAVYVSLQEKQQQCESWIKRVESIMHDGQTHPIAAATMRALLDDHHYHHLPLVPSIQSNIEMLTTRALDTAQQVQDIIKRAQTASRLSDRPLMREVHQALKRVHMLPIMIEGAEQLKNESLKVDGWTGKARKAFRLTRGGSKTLEMTLDELLENVKTITSASLKNRNDVYCICRSTESGMMIECDLCHEWYHGPCVKVSRREAKANSSYVCPICDRSSSGSDIIKDRIDLTILVEVLQDAEKLSFVPKSYGVLAELTRRMKTYQEAIQAFCQSKTSPGPEDLARIRQYLRELEGLDIGLPGENDVLRHKLETASPLAIPLPHSLAAPGSTSTSASSATATAATVQAASPWASEASGGPMPGRIYCVCRRTLNVSDASSQMIGCDTCHEWFHIECVNLTPAMVLTIDQYMCPGCTANKRNNNPPPTPKRPIIKLTVKPPAPPSPSSSPPTSVPPKKRKHRQGVADTTGIEAIGNGRKKPRKEIQNQPSQRPPPTPQQHWVAIAPFPVPPK